MQRIKWNWYRGILFRLVINSDGVGVVRALTNKWKSRIRNRKRSHKLDGIGRIGTFPFSDSASYTYDFVAYNPVKTRLLDSEAEAEVQTNHNASSQALQVLPFGERSPFPISTVSVSRDRLCLILSHATLLRHDCNTNRVDKSTCHILSTDAPACKWSY